MEAESFSWRSPRREEVSLGSMSAERTIYQVPLSSSKSREHFSCPEYILFTHAIMSPISALLIALILLCLLVLCIAHSGLRNQTGLGSADLGTMTLPVHGGQMMDAVAL